MPSINDRGCKRRTKLMTTCWQDMKSGIQFTKIRKTRGRGVVTNFQSKPEVPILFHTFCPRQSTYDHIPSSVTSMLPDGT